ncbi:MAG: hypothetical protein ACPHAP_08820, partial [Candidatus Puniceispirillaceae bacterium]
HDGHDAHGDHADHDHHDDQYDQHDHDDHDDHDECHDHADHDEHNGHGDLGDHVDFNDHDDPDGFSAQNCFPDSLPRQSFYQPAERGFEREIAKRLAYWDRLRKVKLYGHSDETD